MRPAFEDYDNDAYTDDEESEKDSEEEEDDEVRSEDGDVSVVSRVEELEGESEAVEPVQELLGSQEEEGSDAPGLQTDDGNDDESDTTQVVVAGGAPGTAVEDGDGDSAMGSIEESAKSDSGSARESAQGGSNFKYEGGRFVGAEGAEELRVQSKQIPAQFDPSKYSPIFFG